MYYFKERLTKIISITIFFRVFEFNTTSTSAYPYHLLELDSKTIHNHKTFDIPHLRKIKTIPTAVALPKAITRGTLTVREHHKK